MRHITIKLTGVEADALLFAAGNILDSGSSEEILSFYGNRREVSAGHRAMGKIRKQLRLANEREIRLIQRLQEKALA